MKFLKLQVENFMALASAEVELDQRGLVLIQGVNSGDSSAASNGAGKSTLMNSLMWCLYGETAHGVKGDDVLSTGHEKNCRVRHHSPPQTQRVQEPADRSWRRR